MIRQTAQAGVSKGFRQKIWRNSAYMLALSLLFTHLTWAGSLCLCQPGAEASGTGCQMLPPPDQSPGEASESHCHTTPDPDRTTQVMPIEARPHFTHHCSESESPIADARPGQLANSTMVCCHLQPGAEAQAVPATSQNQGLVVAPLPSIHVDAQSSTASLSYSFHHPHQKRPLYLSHSCLLI